MPSVSSEETFAETKVNLYSHIRTPFTGYLNAK